MFKINLEIEFMRSPKDLKKITLGFDDQKELTKYVVKREKRLDEWL